jgi:lipopolysaccharide export system permease protein
MLKFFDRYLLRELTPPFFIGLLVYSFVLLMNQVFLLSELFIAKGVSFDAIVRIFVYLIPSVLAFAVPMSVLMGILAASPRIRRSSLSGPWVSATCGSSGPSCFSPSAAGW